VSRRRASPPAAREGEPVAVRARGRPSALAADRLEACADAGPGRGGRRARLAPHPAAYVRHPPPRRRGPPGPCPGPPRARRYRDDPDIYPRRPRAAARRAPPPSPACLSGSASLRTRGPNATLPGRMELTAVMARVAIVAVPLLVAGVLHEGAHGVVAYACGDPTAARAGRLTLNPLAHVDPVGTLLVP